ncbi:MAG: hypothetical protein IJZ21_03675 [Clostridia bacterium]|nr:hypothetical protein [Clostridia bacterium]
MFGYVRACKPELKIKEYETYKAVYCSLCKKLGKSYGILSRFTLSYDFTFLALLNMSLTDGCDGFVQKRCAFNPLKRCNYCKDDSAIDMPAAAAMIMLYYKILDNIADERGIKKIGYYLLKPVFSSAHKKAAKQYPNIETAVAEYITAQNALEKAECASIDEAADPTAKVMEKILAICSDDETQKRILSRLGYCLGRYIYLLDAAVDLEDDKKTGSYNVLKNTDDKDIENRIKQQLYFCVNESSKAFELLDIKKYKHILGNIIYLGLEETFMKELNK